MFVREKKNTSGTVSIQVIDKQRGRYQVVRSFGASSDPDIIKRYKAQAHAFINEQPNQGKLFATVTSDTVAIERFTDSLNNTNVRTIGPELIFGTLFDHLGFSQIKDELFRHLVIARLTFPLSKLKTTDYLYRYRGTYISASNVYRFLDKLNKSYKKEVEGIAYQYTKKTLNNISVVFYDLTTLYFEAEDEDDLRKIGFSKDGKFQKPQIMLGLLVGERGLPIGYDIFEGNTFEGHTLLPTLEKIQDKYGFDKPTVVADAALLSKKNLENLEQTEYRFIIGARIKNETAELQKKILAQACDLKDGESFRLKRSDGTYLVVSYSDKRAKKDRHNRQRGLQKLKNRLKYGKLTKEHINNRGYNKFLKLEGNITVTVDEEKAEADRSWDGLKGYITNTNLRAKKVIENYSQLWQIERAFRISKTDLRIRPIYHYRRRRIEAHICIAFVAYTIWKELERLLIKANVEMSPKRAGELTQNMYALEYIAPGEVEKTCKVLGLDDKQQVLYDVINNM